MLVVAQWVGRVFWTPQVLVRHNVVGRGRVGGKCAGSRSVGRPGVLDASGTDEA